jgi:hypothetical protein
LTIDKVFLALCFSIAIAASLLLAAADHLLMAALCGGTLLTERLRAG